MTRNTSYLFFIIFVGTIIDSFGVAVLSDKNQLEPIKPSPIDESQEEQSSEKTPTKFNPSVVEIISDNYKKRESTSSVKNEKLIEEDKTKRTHGRHSERDELNCCSNRFETSSGRLESLQVTTRLPEINRYPDRYGNRPDDRFTWHSSSGRPGGSSSTNSGSYGGSGGNTDRRFGLRPTYHNNNDGDYGRPGASNTNRPVGGRPGYSYGYGSGYGDNGAYGSQGFEVNQRPGSIHFSGGSSGRPPGGYGVYGTVGEQDEFPSGSAEGGNGAPIPSNIHTQKAVALKALAGVALIGAAAALAANPALIPVSAVLAGRKRRSIQKLSYYDLLEFPEQFIRDHVPQINENDQVAMNFWNSRQCVARLTCEVQKEYVTAIRNDRILLHDVQQWLAKMFVDRINDVPSYHHLPQNIKMLPHLSADVNLKEGKCEMFACDLFLP